MPLVVPQAARLQALKLINNTATQENLVLKLFQNNLTPTSATSAGDLTEATFTGYSSFNLVSGNWTDVAADTSSITYNSSVEFTSTAGSQNQNIYGYYIVGASSGDLKWVERFSAAPYTVVNDQDKISVTPRLLSTGL